MRDLIFAARYLHATAFLDFGSTSGASCVMYCSSLERPCLVPGCYVPPLTDTALSTGVLRQAANIGVLTNGSQLITCHSFFMEQSEMPGKNPWVTRSLRFDGTWRNILCTAQVLHYPASSSSPPLYLLRSHTTIPHSQAIIHVS